MNSTYPAGCQSGSCEVHCGDPACAPRSFYETPRSRRLRLRLEELKSLGFDQSKHAVGGAFYARCSKCAAVVIQNVPTHETGCTNQTYECNGCFARVKRANSYCEECQS